MTELMVVWMDGWINERVDGDRLEVNKELLANSYEATSYSFIGRFICVYACDSVCVCARVCIENKVWFFFRMHSYLTHDFLEHSHMFWHTLPKCQ